MKTQIDTYIESKKHAWSANTMRSERHRLMGVVEWLNLPPEQFYELAVERYGAYTVKTLMQRVAKFKQEAANDSTYADFIRASARLFKAVYVKKVIGITFEEARERISKLPSSPEQQACMLMLTTGMRVEEALKYDGSGRVVGKGAKARTVYSSASINGDTSYLRVYRTLKSVGLTPHDLRKLAASKLAASGFKEADLMAVMGWSNIQTASKYLQPMLNNEMEQRLKEALK